MSRSGNLNQQVLDAIAVKIARPSGYAQTLQMSLLRNLTLKMFPPAYVSSVMENVERSIAPWVIFVLPKTLPSPGSRWEGSDAWEE
jgi:hypothetical protein